MQFISTTFRTPFKSTNSNTAPSSKPEQEKVSVFSVIDIRIETIDKQSRQILGSVDLRTDPSSGLYSEIDCKVEWTCRYKNFFLGEKKETNYVDSEGKNQKPEQRYFEAYRNVSSWSEKTGTYENLEDLANFKEFCRVCNVERVVYPPRSKE